MSPPKEKPLPAGGEVPKPKNGGAFDLINELTDIQATNSAGDLTMFNQPSEL